MKTCPVCDTGYPDNHATCTTDGAVLIEVHELSAGDMVRGKYRILRKLGNGGMGVVYLAEHLLLGGQVALKFLASELSRNPQFIKRFRNEARAAFQLRHPNIVEVMDLDPRLPPSRGGKRPRILFVLSPVRLCGRYEGTGFMV